MKTWLVIASAAVLSAAVLVGPSRAVTISFSDPSGLSAEVEFSLLDASTLQVRATNTSTGAPDGFDSSDQILTSVSWNFGGLTSIASGGVVTGPASSSVNFSVANVGPGADVSGEYGYGNGGTTGLNANFISANQSHATPFGGSNLDGPVGLNGPQGGLIASPAVVPLGGLGAIQYEWIATLTLSDPLAGLEFLSNGLVVEFGSDAAFLTGTPDGGGVIPEPSTVLMGLLGAAGLLARRRWRRRCTRIETKTPVPFLNDR